MLEFCRHPCKGKLLPSGAAHCPLCCSPQLSQGPCSAQQPGTLHKGGDWALPKLDCVCSTCLFPLFPLAQSVFIPIIQVREQSHGNPASSIWKGQWACGRDTSGLLAFRGIFHGSAVQIPAEPSDTPWVSAEVNLGGHAPVLLLAELEDQGSAVLNQHSQMWEWVCL